jgi:hypothetical protein
MVDPSCAPPGPSVQCARKFPRRRGRIVVVSTHGARVPPHTRINHLQKHSSPEKKMTT